MVRSGNSFTCNIVIHPLWSGQAIHLPAMVRSEPDHSWQPGTQNRFLTHMDPTSWAITVASSVYVTSKLD